MKLEPTPHDKHIETFSNGRSLYRSVAMIAVTHEGEVAFVERSSPIDLCLMASFLAFHSQRGWSHLQDVRMLPMSLDDKVDGKGRA